MFSKSSSCISCIISINHTSFFRKGYNHIPGIFFPFDVGYFVTSRNSHFTVTRTFNYNILPLNLSRDLIVILYLFIKHNGE